VERASNFSDVVERLSGYEVIALDRRGHGSRYLEGVGSLDDHVGDILGLIDDRPATVVGQSIGGLAVIGAALREPARIRAVGLYETSILFAEWWTDEARDRMIAEIDTNAAAAIARAADLSPEDRAQLEVAWASCRQDVLDGFAAPFNWRALAPPVVTGYGGASESPAVRDAQFLASFFGRDPVVLSGAGHRAHRSHPDLFVDFVIRCHSAGSP
jgi:pimeloyl-ACP methyl ester carboxylesterase